MNAEAKRIVRELGLSPLPEEGGFFRPIWEGEARGPQGRPVASSILFLMTPADFSAWHRISMEELWQFHAGDPVEHFQLNAATGALRVTLLGAGLPSSASAQCVVRSQTWQAARPQAGTGRKGWSLVGCTVMPGWDDAGFELARRADLRRRFPRHAEQIRDLTR